MRLQNSIGAQVSVILTCPLSLLSLTKEKIPDLLAYVLSGGDRTNGAFKK